MNLILGIDEVGRGPFAGPLTMGACILRPRYDGEDELISSEEWQLSLRDSKKLSVKRREALDVEIREKALAYGLGWVYIDELNEVGLADGLKLACYRAVEDLKKHFPDAKFDEIIIDGQQNFLSGTKYDDITTTLVKGDDKVKEISAASIIAKVARDNYMYDVALEYPEYGFEHHVGYGTPQHKKALKDYGVCPEHRLFLRPVAQIAGVSVKHIDQKCSTTAAGRKAEEAVAKELKRRGHKILARNYKTKYYEIDIVSATKDHIYFTEVKYRKNKIYGDPLEFINAKKRERMNFAASLFMKALWRKLPQKKLPSPVLAAASVFGEDFQFETWLEIEG